LTSAAIAAFTALALLVPCAAGTAAVPAPPALLSQISGTRAYRHVLALSRTIGPHEAGTPQDRTSGEYIADQLTHDGYPVEWQSFTFPFFAVHEVSLTVPSSPVLAVRPRVMEYSASTPRGGLAARLAEAGLGRPEDLSKANVSGKIALIERGGLTFRQKAENAAAAGAVAAIVYNQQPSAFAGTLGQAVRIPVVGLSGDDGQKLLALVRAGAVTVRLNVQATNEERMTWNIIATKTGTQDPHRILIVGAHRDTVGDAPGANDNTSGVAVALEIAEVLKDVPLGMTVRFVFFGGEEEGLFGSAYYVEHPGPDPIAGMINLDMEGVGPRLVLAAYRSSDVLVLRTKRLADGLGIKVQVNREGASDHVNFEKIGVPVVLLFRPDDPYYDTPRDTVDRVDPALLEVSGRLALATILDVAGPRH
jgi:aminopeptidase YwaD